MVSADDQPTAAIHLGPPFADPCHQVVAVLIIKFLGDLIQSSNI
jgi:hypothetical protein